jgi:hypothetical protein
VLFLVSAGNANSPLELDVARADVAALDAAGFSAFQKQTMPAKQN